MLSAKTRSLPFPDHHVSNGYRTLLRGYLLVVDHLERHLFHHTPFLPRPFHLEPWREIYTRLPKRIYSKFLATSDLETKYKLKVRALPTAWNASHRLFLPF